ncbi:MAG: response regulator transcription factor [Tissierellia bacterium]|nr:response regulator transcription factor [Tissierellia bacterium]
MRLLIFDDHKLLGESLTRALLEYDQVVICDFVFEEDEFYNKLKNQTYDILLLDINLKDATPSNGFELLEQIRRDLPEIKVVILSSYDMPLYRQKALDLGAYNYINKSIEVKDLVKRLEEVNSGKTRKSKASPDQLTEREVEVLKEIVTGKVKKDIAEDLFISERTLYNHIQNIYDKLGVKNTIEAYNEAIKLGYIEPLM